MKDVTLLERLHLGSLWENVRLSSFRLEGDSEKVEELIVK